MWTYILHTLYSNYHVAVWLAYKSIVYRIRSAIAIAPTCLHNKPPALIRPSWMQNKPAAQIRLTIVLYVIQFKAAGSFYSYRVCAFRHSSVKIGLRLNWDTLMYGQVAYMQMLIWIYFSLFPSFLSSFIYSFSLAFFFFFYFLRRRK